jgi:hypothetical protein
VAKQYINFNPNEPKITQAKTANLKQKTRQKFSLI